MKYFHSHLIVVKKCKGDMRCVRACPTQALRFRNNKILLYDDLCVDCGECINVCEENVFIPVIDEISEFDKYKFKIAIPSKIFYTQFPSSIYPAVVHQALKKIGFDVVLNVSQELHEMGFAISEYIKSNPESMPIISSNCPAVIRLIQVSYPHLMGLISPFDVPREIVAKNAKTKYSKELEIDIKEIGVIYLTPCPAKVVSIKQPAEKEKSWIDNAIAINDIYKILIPEILHMNAGTKAKASEEKFYYCKGWGVLNFLQQSANFRRYMSVHGIKNIKMILNDIEDSRLKNIDYIEASACQQGCIGGAFCVENPYIAWHNSKLLEKSYGKPVDFDGKVVLKKYKDRFFLEKDLLPRTTRTLSADLSDSIKRMKQKERIYAKLPGKECGLCGAPNCETFAEDCARGETDMTECYFLRGTSL